MKLRWALGFGGALLLVLALALACRDDSKPAQAPASSKAEKAAKASSPRQPGVFRRLAAEPTAFDPHLVADVQSATVAVEVFGGLVTISTEVQLKPDLAERWEVSPDRKTYTFFLRRDARFHNGKPVTAQDVKYSLERALDPKTGSPTVSTYLDDIVGAKEKLAGRAQEVAGVQVIDPQTLQITIDAPKAYFLAKLTYPAAFVLDRENILKEGKDWTRRPNGTGPFKLKEYKLGERLVLERNPHYHLGPAKLERVEFILSGGSAMAMYENGEVDITGVGLADLDRVTNPNEPLNKELVVAPPSFDISYIGFNVSQPPFDDVKVRQALNHAIDKQLIAKQVMNNLVVPAYSILPPGFPGYTGQVRGLDFDPKKARELLAASRYAGRMPRIVITVPGTGGSAGLDLEVVAEQWKQTLGIQVEFQQVEWATFLGDLNARKPQLFAGLAWAADYPDPQNFLDILFHSRSPLNHTGYSNANVDRLVEQARVAASWEERVSLYQQAEQLIVAEAAWLPLWYTGDRMVLIKPYVKGYKPTPLIVPKLREVSIEG
jgi:oligopeptide transport system substrate-binding protein